MDNWDKLISENTDSGIIRYCSEAEAGQFTKKMISVAKLVMMRTEDSNNPSFIFPTGIVYTKNVQYIGASLDNEDYFNGRL